MDHTLSVLIADDDEGHVTLVQRNIKRAGLTADLIHLRDGQDLLDYMYRQAPYADRREHHAIVMVLDLNMPRLSGMDVLKRLKQDDVFARIPVFVLTTTDNPVEIDRCYALGASVCLVKPVDFGAFGAMIQRLAAFLMSAVMPSETSLLPRHGRRA